MLLFIVEYRKLTLMSKLLFQSSSILTFRITRFNFKWEASGNLLSKESLQPKLYQAIGWRTLRKDVEFHSVTLKLSMHTT